MTKGPAAGTEAALARRGDALSGLGVATGGAFFRVLARVPDREALGLFETHEARAPCAHLGLRLGSSGSSSGSSSALPAAPS